MVAKKLGTFDNIILLLGVLLLAFALTIAVVGIGLVFDLLPFRLFTAGTLKEIVTPAGRQG